jgi:hypothetical protein
MGKFRTLPRVLGVAALLIGVVCVARGGEPFALERVLPDDTLFFITAKNFPAAKAIFDKSPYGRLWADAGSRAFREKFHQRIREDLLTPIERELDIQLNSFTNLLNGSVTYALVPEGAEGSITSGWMLLFQSPEAASARTNLAAAQAKWSASGKKVRNETIVGHEFVVLSLPPESAIRKFKDIFPRQLEFQEAGRVQPPPQDALADLVIGQVGELFIVSGSGKAVEKLLARHLGGAAPAVAGQAAYEVCHNALFRNANVYAWLNAGPVMQILGTPPKRTAPPPPSVVDIIEKEKLVRGAGLTGLKSAGLAVASSPEGLTFEALLSVPAAERQGLFRLLAGNPKEAAIPAFVPADVVRFQRWRIQGMDAWETTQKMMAEISPQWTSAMNFIIDTANEAANLTDQSFDVRKNLLGNLGDDFIWYTKSPRTAEEDPEGGPTLLLVQSPNAENLAAALQRILIFLSAAAEKPLEREFLGRKIFSVPLPSIPLPVDNAPMTRTGRTLHYAATTGYVALSTDAATLEEFIRSPESNAKALRDTPGLREATALVTNPSTSLFLFENQRALIRMEYEAARTAKNTNTLLSLPVPGMARPERPPQDWLDFTLLPPFEAVAKHFDFLVRGSSSTTEGIRLKWFMPEPRGE